MKRLIAAVIAALALCSYSANTDKPKAALNTWTYDGHRAEVDSSYWSGINNKAQITFVRRDSGRRSIKDEHIGVSFLKWPVTEGRYRIVAFPRADTEAMVIATHGRIMLSSKLVGSSYLYISKKVGKLAFWANDVMMDIKPRGFKSHSGDWDSTRLSFYLKER